MQRRTNNYVVKVLQYAASLTLYAYPELTSFYVLRRTIAAAINTERRVEKLLPVRYTDRDSSTLRSG